MSASHVTRGKSQLMYFVTTLAGCLKASQTMRCVHCSITPCWWQTLLKQSLICVYTYRQSWRTISAVVEPRYCICTASPEYRSVHTQS